MIFNSSKVICNNFELDIPITTGVYRWHICIDYIGLTSMGTYTILLVPIQSYWYLCDRTGTYTILLVLYTILLVPIQSYWYLYNPTGSYTIVLVPKQSVPIICPGWHVSNIKLYMITFVSDFTVCLWFRLTCFFIIMSPLRTKGDILF
jgi:hypothetical protein